jgi:hypothetical protein
MEDLIPVRVRECPDGSHPEGDHVYILPQLSLDGGIAARQDMTFANAEHPVTAADIDDQGNWITENGRLYDAALIRRWMVTFCRYGAVSWTLHSPGGQVWPFDVNVLLQDAELGYEVADKADDYYRGAVMRPLVQEPSKPSPRGDLDGSTSAKPKSTGSPRRRSSHRASAGRRSGAHTA